MDRDNASTATQADSGMTRRGVMRRGLIASGATLGVGYAGGRSGAIGGARAAAPLVGFAAVSLGYLVVAGAEKYLGDTRDYSGYTGADALHAALYEGCLNMKSADERVMTSVSNNIATSESVALAKGKAALLSAMNSGANEGTAQTAMVDAVNSYYSTIEKNILTHVEAQMSQFVSMSERVEAHEDIGLSNVFHLYAEMDSEYLKGPYEYIEEAATYDLLDGTTYPVDGVQYSSASLGNLSNGQGVIAINGPKIGADSSDLSNPDRVRFRIQDPELPQDRDNETEFIHIKDYTNTLADIKTMRDEVTSTLSGFTSDVYAQYSPGDIPTDDLVDPVTAATELSQSYGGAAGQSAMASMLGIPTSAEQSVTMTVHRDAGDITLQADIFTNYTPPDTGEFVKDTRYKPSTWDKPLYIAYEYTDSETGEEGSDFSQLEDPFTIVNIEANGEEIDSFKPESPTQQTTDLSKIQEELESIRKEQIRLQEEAEEEMNSGGGAGAGFFGDLGGSASNLGIVALGGAVVALLLGNR
ncbi:VP4 precursor [Halorubrum pleomorphic virus 12]|uniref:VP4 n=1 Tax=Halorubrum pleomorphic virus 12 TaxID=2507578 RepID=A0A410N6N5_9VIRU|nr:VP4 precursor [Halorubrum pleomorphic virus 12]QAS68808.1 VP4 precursor [Halorubrum pleomorphic virus 12]